MGVIMSGVGDSLATPTPQLADRGVYGHSISRWPCTGITDDWGECRRTTAGLSRRPRVSFGVESQVPQTTQIVLAKFE